jgi:hypothetical protein
VPNGLKGWLKVRVSGIAEVIIPYLMTSLGASQTFGGSFLNALPSEQEREAVLQEVEEELLRRVEADRVRHRQRSAGKAEGEKEQEEPYSYARDHFSDAENRNFVARYVRLRVKAVAV